MDFKMTLARFGKASIKALLMVAVTLWATVAIAGVNEDLAWAAYRGDLAEVKRLLARGADVNAKDQYGGTALMSASLGGHLKVVEALVAKGADVNAKGVEGNTALMAASQRGKPEIVQALIEKGARVNEKNQLGATALFFAYLEGHQEIQELLIKAGAKKDLNMQIFKPLAPPKKLPEKR